MLKTGRSFGKKETIENTLVKLRKSELRKKIKKKRRQFRNNSFT
jgi:hypothetical protein